MKVIVGIIGAVGMISFPALMSDAHLKYVASHGSHSAAPNDTSYGASHSPKKEAKKSRVGVRSMKMIVTAYYKPLPGQRKYVTGSYRQDRLLNGCGKKTALGKIPKKGTIAADTRLFRSGTVFYVPGYGWGRVADRGGSIRGRHLDIFMGPGRSGLDEASRWGRRTISVSIFTAASTMN